MQSSAISVNFQNLFNSQKIIKKGRNTIADYIPGNKAHILN